MTPEDIARNLDKILWGKSIVVIDGRFTEESTLVLRSLNIAESNFVNHVYERVLVDGMADGILTDDELKAFYLEKEIWTDEDDSDLEVFVKEITIFKSQIKDAEYFPVKQKQLRKKLANASRKLKEKKASKSQLFNCSAETRAAEISRRFMVMMSTEDLDGNPRWENKEAFLKEVDIDLIFNLALGYYNYNIFPESEMREMARSSQWRFKWQASKAGSDLFGRPISEWSEMQDALVYWSQFYDYVFDSPDRPSQLIIDDDDSCDAWVNDQIKGRKLGAAKRQKESSAKSTRSGGKMTGTRQEQFVMVEHGDVDTVQRVQEMNPNSVRSRLQREAKQLKESGKRLTEWQLRGKEYLATLEGN